MTQPVHPTCGCSTTYDAEILYCPLHDAAGDLLAAVRYTADMLAQDAGNGETVGERIGLIGGFRAAELCRTALARIDPTPPRTT
jgi:hypothetical protein